ncbi:MAG: thiamine pyrophosphate-binding protein [Magnetococcales bacterium]|nr:thiamine pyrophosphate-binding protein [Magnetococcales bacterium]
MVRVADFIAKRLVEAGIRHIFMVTGGGAMHLNDAFGRNPDLQCIFCHHEQACSIAADGYFRASDRMAVVNVTTGPGGTNAITGVYGAWTDSIPILVVSGQVKYETYVGKYDTNLRQLGDQEINIISLVRHITKYSEVVSDPTTIRHHLEKALHLALSGRPGPVWLDVPIDVQGAMVDETRLAVFTPEPPFDTTESLNRSLDELLARLATAHAPVIMLGSGIAVSQTRTEAIHLADRLGIPVVTAWNAHYLIEDDYPYYVGRPGTVGDRAGNMAVQNADLLLVLGCRLNIRQVSYNWSSFADRAFQVMVDIDPEELNKPTLRIDLKIQADLRDFFCRIAKRSLPHSLEWPHWLAWCRERRARYAVVKPDYYHDEPINPYVFLRELSDRLEEGAVTVCGNGSACVISFQSFIIRKNQRLFTNSGCAAMGYDLPAAIGASLALGKRRIVCLAGDGSLMMNFQELQTLVAYNLPICLFIINNDGYLSIAQTQHAYFPDSLTGFNPATGVTFPDFGKISEAFGLPFRRIRNLDAFRDGLDTMLNGQGPVVCEVIVNKDQPFSPKLASRKREDGTMVSPRLEEMFPFLPEDEMRLNVYPVYCD